MDLDIAGRCAVVTGGASGIGRACCRILAGEGAEVCVADIDLDAARRVRDELGRAGARCVAARVDVTDEQSVAALFDTVAEEFGGADLLVNSAGIVTISPLTRLAVADWDRVMAVNARGVFLCIREYLARRGESGHAGAVVNISSQAGKVPVNLEGHYSASKAAVNMLTQAFALEAAPLGVRVNAVCPGSIESALNRTITEERARVLGMSEAAFLRRTIDNTPLKRQGRVEEVAWLAAYLASPRAAFVTGQCVNITGGRVLH